MLMARPTCWGRAYNLKRVAMDDDMLKAIQDDIALLRGSNVALVFAIAILADSCGLRETVLAHLKSASDGFLDIPGIEVEQREGFRATKKSLIDVIENFDEIVKSMSKGSQQ